jgi:tRNA G18 (ribose-2'-O)-methylase SpoU
MSIMTETRNIIDYYHYWNTEAIKADLDSKRHNFSILCSNLYNDFNIGTIIRNANAFLANEVIIYGHKKWDRRGAVGTQNYTNFNYVPEIKNLNEKLREFDIILGIDNIENSINIQDYQWNYNKKTLLCLGQEQVGLPQEIIDKCDDILYIKQYGSVRSINVGTASGIVMYEYCVMYEYLEFLNNLLLH